VARGLNRGEVRLVRFSRPDKQRPALVMTRQSAISYLGWVTVAPITSTIRDVPSEVRLGPDDGMKQPCAVNLYNLVTLRADRVGKLVTVLGATRMSEVCRSLDYALGCT
jgi:mRNA interferase MazF